MTNEITIQSTPPEGNDFTPAEQGGTPTLLAGKFSSKEDLATGTSNLLTLLGTKGRDEDAYKALASLLGTQPNAEVAPATPPESTPNAPSGQLDFSKYDEEFRTNGTISEASFTELETKGLPRTVVTAYIEGLKAQTTQLNSKVHAAAGGEENYNAMLAWASANLSEAEANAFNSTIATGDINKISLAVTGLTSRWRTSSVGSGSPLLIGGTGNAEVHGDVFESVAQMTAAMSDPKYTTDPAFRKAVIAKLSRSNVM